jgi:hypothetical protein
MIHRPDPKNATTAKTKPFDFWNRLKEIDMFFEERGREHRTMQRVVEKIRKARIPYAIVGGMAVNAHRYQRTTNDVDLLLSRLGFSEFRRRFVPRSYQRVPGRPRRFFDRRNKVHIDIQVTGYFPGSGKPGPITYPNPADVSTTIKRIRVVDLATLIQLKLAARRYTDFADVVNLIRFNGLDESFAEKLHASIRGDFIECLEEKRREDMYEAEQDRAIEEDYPPGEEE